MSSRTTADKVVEAVNTGKEAKFLVNGVYYDFSPEGLAAYITAEGIIPTSLQATLDDFEARIAVLEGA